LCRAAWEGSERGVSGMAMPDGGVEEDVRFQVSIRMPTEDYVVIPDCTGWDTVTALKERIREITGLDPKEYTVVYKDDGVGGWEGDLSSLRVDPYGVALWDTEWKGEDKTLEELGIARLLRRFPALQCPQPAASSGMLRMALRIEPPRAPGAAVKVASLWDTPSFAQGKVRSAHPGLPPLSASEMQSQSARAGSRWRKAGTATRAAVRMAAKVARWAPPPIITGGAIPERNTLISGP